MDDIDARMRCSHATPEAPVCGDCMRFALDRLAADHPPMPDRDPTHMAQCHDCTSGWEVTSRAHAERLAMAHVEEHPGHGVEIVGPPDRDPTPAPEDRAAEAVRRAQAGWGEWIGREMREAVEREAAAEIRAAQLAAARKAREACVEETGQENEMLADALRALDPEKVIRG